MIREGMKNIAAGANPMIVKKGMAKAVETAVGTVIANSKKVEGSDDIARVATVSSADETVGKLIADAMEKVTAEGVITCLLYTSVKFNSLFLSPCISAIRPCPAALYQAEQYPD